MHLLLESKHLQSDLLLLVEFPLLLLLANVGLEVLKLILGGSLAFLIVVDGLGDGFDGSVSDGDEYWFFIFALFFAFDLLFFLSDLFSKLADAYFILNYFLDIVFDFFLFLLISESIFGVEKGSSYVGFNGGDFGFRLLLHLL